MQSEGTMVAQVVLTGARKAHLVTTTRISSTPALVIFRVGNHFSDRRRLMKVLIIEDDSDMCDLLGILVERLGYDSLLATKGEEGVEKAIAEKPSLILVDMKMPIMNGWEVARRLRANAETKEIPILAITALYRFDDLNACLEAGCTAYIVKPFGAWDLQTKIGELLAGTKELPA
jgi:two-component system, cell cycle response regulator DivK